MILVSEISRARRYGAKRKGRNRLLFGDPRVFHHFRRCPYSVLFRERPRKQRNRLAASYPTTIDKHPRINTDMLGWGGSVVGFFGFV